MKKAACKGSAKKKKNLTYDITVRGQDINVRGLNEIVLGSCGATLRNWKNGPSMGSAALPRDESPLNV